MTDTWEYDEHAFMRFIPQHKNYYYDYYFFIMINHGGNGYYSSTVTHVKYHFEYLLHSYEKFKDAMEYLNFYKLCLHYDFMSFAPSCIESFVKCNNDIIQSRVIFMIK